MTEVSTRQRLEDEYLFTKDYPAIHKALQEGRTMIGCAYINAQKNPFGIPDIFCALETAHGIDFRVGEQAFMYADSLEVFQSVCKRIDASFIIPYASEPEDFVQRTGKREPDSAFATFCMWAGAATLAIVLAALILAILAAANH